MTTKRKVLLYSTLSIGSTASVVAATISCGPTSVESENFDSSKGNPEREKNKVLNNILNPVKKVEKGSGTLNKLASAHTFRRNINSEYKASGLPFDLSYSYGGNQLPLADATTGRLVTIENKGEALIKEEVKATPTGNEEKRYVLRPAVWKYRLELADAIVVTKKDGTKVTFDSDEVDALKEQPNEQGFFESPYVVLTSQNAKSINSKAFEEALKDAKQVDFRMRKNVTWSNYKGEATTHKLTANDFYVGYLRTYSYSTAFRRANGGSKEMDERSRQLVAGDNSWASDKQTYGNEYLMGLYGVDSKLVRDKGKFVTKEGDNEFVSFYQKGTENVRWDLMIKNLTDSYEWVPAPSEYIEKGYGDNANGLKTVNTTADLNAIHLEISKAKDIAKLTGYYWYGTTFENTLYLGKYVGQKFDPTLKAESVILNKNYWDKTFVNDPTRLQVIQQIYEQKPVDGKQFNQTLFNLYKSGDTSLLPYSQLEPAVQDTIKKEAKLFGLTYSQEKNTSSFTLRGMWSLSPDAAVGGREQKPASLNTTAAKLLFGQADLTKLAKGEVDNVFDTSAAGTGRTFRQLLSAAVNWSHYANEISTGVQQKPWNWGFATDAKIGGSNQETTAHKTLRSALDELNKYFVTGLDGNKITLGKYGTDLNLKISEDAALNAGANDKIKSAAFAELKAEMKKLLDKFFTDNPTLPKTIQFDVPARYVNTDDKYYNTTVLVLDQVFKQLDPRIDAKFIKVANGDELRDKWLNGRVAFKLMGWGYDYDGLGSGLDGMSWQPLMLPLLSKINSAHDKFKAFPEMVKTAKELDEFLKEEGNKPTIPFADWHTLQPKDLEELAEHLGSYTYDKTKGFEEIKDKTKLGLDGGSLSAKFWINFQTKHTNEELLKLVNEIGNMYGVSFAASNSVQAELFRPTVSNPNYVYPVAYDNHFSFGDVTVVQPKK
ncbi:OppA family ABC transporter substrate-binding lipoprotein [Mycoplasma crocodyli]|uniref:Putative intrinsic membrane protein n=1 Tax=Mycoplasma crocodyli (strain ATCC 51981 / MP145) TaxID=512564 RepID=D5E636_MYCCM|nr:hypothetical protein [Mycoplasma crocodyli]ADE19796.1 putative intrinsic membrane protein [Mycoplasma crocodyli MP145]